MSSIYITCEDLNFDWKYKEIRKVMKLWLVNCKIEDIAEAVNRPYEEVFLLLMDLINKGELEPRTEVA